MTHGEGSFLNSLHMYVQSTADENSLRDELQGETLLFESGQEIISQGQQFHTAFILNEGWACSFKQLMDGARQVIDINIPGDFLGLRNLMLRRSDQSIVAVTEVEVRVIDKAKLRAVVDKRTQLASALFCAMAREQAIIVEHLVNLGRRDARDRTVHLLLELGARMELAGRSNEEGFECPLSQSMLADALGLTAVHLNRVLRQLRLANLLMFRDHFVTFTDLERLAEISGFDVA